MKKIDPLVDVYTERYYNYLLPLAQEIEHYLDDILKEYPRIDRVSGRAKTIKSFIEKSEKTLNHIPKYADPINEIQDQIGARIVTFYSSDLDKICQIIEKNFGPIEKLRKEPETDNEFGYEGYHYILFIPNDLIYPYSTIGNCPRFFELQIRTLFQHAWAQANHDLVYKPTSTLTKEQRRKVAFTAAQAWGADNIFDDLFQTLN